MSFNIFDEVDTLTEKSDKANQASYASLSTLRIVSKVLGGVLHHSEGLSPDDLEKNAQTMLEKIGSQTTSLHEKLGMPPENFALASITGSVAQVISDHYRRVGPKALEMDWADTLSKVSDMEGIWKENYAPNESGSLEVRRSLAMMESLSPVISAYQRFNYFHSDQEAVINRVGNQLWNTVDESITGSQVAGQMSENEREMLRTNLLKRAGELFADSWDSMAAQVMAAYKESPADQRRIWMTEGYPLLDVENRFESQFEMLNQAMSVSLSVHSGFDQDESSSPSPGQ